MFKFLILLVVVLAMIAWSAFQALQTVESADPQPKKEAALEERLQAVLQKKHVRAEDLAELCTLDPELASQLLKNQTLYVEGNIEDCHVRGIDFVDLEIRMKATSNKSITFRSDFAALKKPREYFPYKLSRAGDSVLIYTVDQRGVPSTAGKVILQKHQKKVIEGIFLRIDRNTVQLKIPAIRG